MRRLVEQLLDAARARQAGGIPVSLGEARDLRPLVARIVDEVRASHPNRWIVQKDAGPAIAEFDDPSATEFHMAAITYRDGTAVAYIGDTPGQARAIALPSGMRFDFVGIPSSTTPQGPSLRSFGGFQARPPENPRTGADLAEVIVWPRALSKAEMEATRRYLRKKYALAH